MSNFKIDDIFSFIAKYQLTKGDWQSDADVNEDGTIIKAEFSNWIKKAWKNENSQALDNDIINKFWNTFDTNKSAKTISGNGLIDLNALNSTEIEKLNSALEDQMQIEIARNKIRNHADVQAAMTNWNKFASQMKMQRETLIKGVENILDLDDATLAEKAVEIAAKLNEYGAGLKTFAESNNNQNSNDGVTPGDGNNNVQGDGTTPVNPNPGTGEAETFKTEIYCDKLRSDGSTILATGQSIQLDFNCDKEGEVTYQAHTSGYGATLSLNDISKGLFTLTTNAPFGGAAKITVQAVKDGKVIGEKIFDLTIESASPTERAKSDMTTQIGINSWSKQGENDSTTRVSKPLSALYQNTDGSKYVVELMTSFIKRDAGGQLSANSAKSSISGLLNDLANNLIMSGYDETAVNNARNSAESYYHAALDQMCKYYTLKSSQTINGKKYAAVPDKDTKETRTLPSFSYEVYTNNGVEQRNSSSESIYFYDVKKEKDNNISNTQTSTGLTLNVSWNNDDTFKIRLDYSVFLRKFFSFME